MQLDDSLTRSRTLQFGLAIAELKRAGRPIISMGLGEPDFETPEHIKDAAYEALRDGLTRYGPAPGLPSLRERIAEKLRADNGIAAAAERIVVTPGAKNALFLACAALLRPGDEVLNLTPCYVSNVPILHLAEPRIVIHDVPMLEPDFGLDRERVRSLVSSKTRLIFINHPNNPTGRLLARDEAEFLREIVAEHDDLYLLSDEIYERMVFGGETVSPGAFGEVADRVITVNGFSKPYAMTGWRIGYAHLPGDLYPTVLKIHQQLNTNTATFVQKAAEAALLGPQDERLAYVETLARRRDLYAEVVNASDALSGPIPGGGLFGFLRTASAGLPSDAFSAQLLESAGVAVIPGIAFGDAFDDYCRISLVCPTDELAEGMRRIRAFVEERAAA